jgi:hypothetical protein
MKKNRLIAILQIITGIGIIVFWIIFLTTDILYPANMSESQLSCYLKHEMSFPIADLILSLALIISAILLLKEKSAGIKLSLVCSGAMIFLGMLDITYNLQNGLFFTSVVDGILAAFICLWVIVFGSFTIFKMKRS